MNDRYTDRPLLRLLECYVLKLIGRLEKVTENQIVAMEPNLRKTYNRDGSWFEILAHELEIGDEDNEKIIQYWQKNLKSVPAKSAQQFAEWISDSMIS